MTAPANPSAATSGASATERFKSDKLGGVAATPPERVDAMATELLDAVHAIIRKHRLTYDEYNALKAWLIGVGQDGEWPLFLDVWVEHVVEEVANDTRVGTKGSIEGPYYVPGAPEFQGEATLPMREGESGTSLLFHGQVTDCEGAPLPGARVEMWHADNEGFYSQFAPGIPEWNLRGTVLTDEQGNFEIRTIQPAPYQIPTDGSCGKLIAAAGWHAWRPAHLHMKVSAPGHQLITTQLYFPGDPHNDDDIASAVKPELILDVQPAEQGTGNQVRYDFRLDPLP